MKRLLTLTVLMTLTLAILFTVDANAQGGKNKKQFKGTKFVDANGDGVCDNASTAPNTSRIGLSNGTKSGTCTGTNGKGDFVDANGDGICDNFVDANGDGICDNCTGTGTGSKHSFVDANGDGICDICGGTGTGTGSCKGYRGGR